MKELKLMPVKSKLLQVEGGVSWYSNSSFASKLVFILEKKENQAVKYHYTYTDHLGSILMVVNKYGQKEYEQNYDAWGRKRNPTDWTYSNIPTAPSYLYRGYTGHEGMPEFRLINMNGRMYDPVVGRMLSADNYIQAGGYTQSYNRYSYAFNNPLKYNDPDGEIVAQTLLGAAIGVTMNGISNLQNGGKFFKGAGRAALIGALQGFVSFGIGEAFSTVSGVGKVVGGAVTHGAVGGLTSSLQGGSFGSGFASGAISSLVGSGTAKYGAGAQIVGGAFSGGVAAEIAGGDFVDGFKQGLITAGLNHAAHSGWLLGEGFAASLITGQTRHIFKPDAVSLSLSADAALGVAYGVEAGGVLALIGNDKGEMTTFGEIGVGIGLEAGANVGLTKFYYSGTANSFKLAYLKGPSVQANFSIAALGEVGFTLSQTPMIEQTKHRVYAIGYTVGFSPTISIQFSIQNRNTTFDLKGFFRQFK